jgi:hypothetical protein
MLPYLWEEVKHRAQKSSYKRFLRNVDVAVGFLGLIPDGEETALDFLEDCGFVIDHAAFKTDFCGSVGDEQVLSLMAVEILDATFFIPIAATEIAS